MPRDNYQDFLRLLEQGRYYAAHECAEEIWIEAGRPRGGALQGAILLAAALEHWRRGNLRGAQKVLLRALRCFSRPPGQPETPAQGEEWLAALQAGKNAPAAVILSDSFRRLN